MTTTEVADLELCRRAVAAGLVPRGLTPEQAYLSLLAGRELGGRGLEGPLEGLEGRLRGDLGDGQEQLRELLRLARHGLPSRRIGEQVGCSHETARNVINAWLKELAEDNRAEAEHYRDRQIERLSACIADLQRKLEADPDNEKLYGPLAKFEALLAKVTGTEAPVKVEADVKSEIVVNFTMG